MDKTQFNEFEDSSIVAYLSLRGHQVFPKKRADGRVVFQIEGDLSKDIQDFYQNTPVGILDFIKTLKSVRSSIFALKALRGK